MERDVNIIADVVVTTDNINSIDRERGRISVVEAYPRGADFGGKTFEEVAQTTFAIEVETIVGGVLRNDDDFLCPVRHEGLSFFNKFVDGT